MITDIETYLSEFTLTEKQLPAGPEDGAGQTRVEKEAVSGTYINKYINQFWTSRQRQASTLHEIAYRACFKAQLPAFFIQLFTDRGDLVYDPFAGRGTTAIEAGLLGRRVVANDINPLSIILTRPRFDLPESNEIARRLEDIRFDYSTKAEIDLSMFYHSRTEAEICSLRDYLRGRKEAGHEDSLDAWIRMVATNRLTGHSSGFFSVYTLPPNQAVSPESQRKINKKREQRPAYRDVKVLILKKSRQLISGLSENQKRDLRKTGSGAVFLNVDSRLTGEIEKETIQLTVTSPPFLDVVQYTDDNWLRCWFNSIDAARVNGRMVIASTLPEWCNFIGEVFRELYRITKRGGWVAFEVGEVKRGKINLDEYVVPLGLAAGFGCKGILINEQLFTKTSNIWGIRNNRRGTNTNRIVIFKKE